MTDGTPTFVTSDFGEVAALRLQGIEPSGQTISISGQVVTFHYTPDPKIDQIIRDYRTDSMRLFDAEVRRVARWARDIKTARVQQ